MRIAIAAALSAVALAAPASAAAQYRDAVLATGGLEGYWRLGETSGSAAADASGRAGPGSYVGAPGLGARGALSADADKAARFDGVDDELHAGAPVTGTLEGWFFWEAGVALMRDSTASAGWILALRQRRPGRVPRRAAPRSRPRWRRRACATAGITSC